MNWNAIKTYILGSGVLVLVVPYIINWLMTLLGCTGDNPATPDVVEVAACTGGGVVSIPLALQALAGSLMAAALLAIKAFAGTGTVKQNLFNPDVPVVATKAEAKPGVVTEAQVAEPGPLK
ncbi:hypothetical protein [Taklimakanibacter deserti]|uniref:hypothetical protein n=1 Tax=Taklimakanibacter deserti TaxID=2267839 RepID=UPI000E6490BA